MKNNILEGISYENNDFIFNFNNDKSTDIVNLKFQSYNKLFSTKNGEKVFYAYKINKEVDPKIVSIIKNSIKQLEHEPEINLMINKSIIGLDSLYPISKFDLIISPKSSSNLNLIITKKLKDKAGINTILANDVIIKNLADNIQVDYSKIKDESLKNRIIQLINMPSGFKIQNVPPRYRSAISNYLKFKDDTSRNIFNTIQQGNVLLIDDILTSGNTLLEMTNLIKSFGANDIYCYIFLSTKK